MPHVNCCVPNCVSTSRRTPSLKFYILPVEKKRRKLWISLIRNDCLRTSSRWTSVCSLHFPGGRKTNVIKDPTIFPWSAEWPVVIEEYNREMSTKVLGETKATSSNTPLCPLPLLTPKHSKAERFATTPARKPPNYI